MLWLILSPLIRLRRALDRLLALVVARALVGGALTLVLLVVPSLSRDVSAAPGLIAAAYALAALGWLPRSLGRVQTARLEARLARQGFTDDALALCAEADATLWSRSLVVDAVRRVRALPTPGALRPAAWTRRVTRLAREQFAPLRPTLFDPTAGLLVVLVVVWQARGDAVALVGVALGIEVLLAVTRVQAAGRVRALERGLVSALGSADTPLASPLIQPAQPPGYAHRRLYRTARVASVQA